MNKLYLRTYGQGPALVMLHGWGMHSGIWHDFAIKLAQYRQVICIDLPGHGNSELISPYQLEHLVEVLLATIPVQKFSVLGWSLGGTLALAMAKQSPERLLSLHLVAANPRFVQSEGWPGVSESIFLGFMQELQQDAALCQKHFLALQVSGQAHAKALLQTVKQIQQQVQPAKQEALLAGLAILYQADFRYLLPTLTCPSSFVFGRLDTLVPVACAESIQQLNADVHIVIIDEAGHLPFLTHSQELIERLLGVLCQSLI